MLNLQEIYEIGGSLQVGKHFSRWFFQDGFFRLILRYKNFFETFFNVIGLKSAQIPQSSKIKFKWIVMKFTLFHPILFFLFEVVGLNRTIRGTNIKIILKHRELFLLFQAS